MDIKEGCIAHKFVGAPSDLSGFTVFSKGQDQGGSFGQIRQLHCHRLFEQNGQSNKVPALSVSSGDLGVVPSVSDLSTCRVSGREGHCFGRLGISSPQQQQQLATPAISFRGDQPPFKSFYCRSLCKQKEYPAASLLQLETQPTGKSGRCIFNVMVSGPALPLPSFQIDWESTLEDPHRRGRLRLSDSSSLASPGIVLSGNEDAGGESNSSPHGVGPSLESRFEPSPSNTGELDVLTAWPVLGKAFHHRAFLKGLQNCSCSPGDPLPIQHTIQPGLSGVAGVLESTLIYFQLL